MFKLKDKGKCRGVRKIQDFHIKHDLEIEICVSFGFLQKQSDFMCGFISSLATYTYKHLNSSTKTGKLKYTKFKFL